MYINTVFSVCFIQPSVVAVWYKNCLAFSCVFMSLQYNRCLHSKQARSGDGSLLSLALCSFSPTLVSPFC